MKQIKLTFTTKTDMFPVQYNSLLLSFIKSRIQDYSQELFEAWFTKTDNCRKSYTFSCFFPSAQFTDGKLILPEKRFSLSLSTYEIQDYIVFYNAFLLFRDKSYPLPSNTCTLESVLTPDIPTIMRNDIIVRMESPLLVRKHNASDNTDKFLAWNDSAFSGQLKEIIQFTARQQGIDVDVSDFDIVPLKAKKTVIAHFGLKVNANLGNYRLEGNPALLNYLYRGGIGSATGSGHGKFTILT